MNFKKILKTVCLSMAIFTISISLSNALSNNQTITKMADLDMDGKQEKIVLKGAELSINGKEKVSLILDTDIADLNIIDINSKDKQKEIVVSSNRSYIGINYIFAYKNKKIVEIKEKDSFNGTIYSEDELKVDSKNNVLLLGRNIFGYRGGLTPFNQEPLIYEKYKLEDNILKEIKYNEYNFIVGEDLNGNPKLWEVIMVKPLNIYKDKQATKVGFTVKKGEKITILSGNLKDKYLKIKKSKDEIGYVPLIFDIDSNSKEEYSWSQVKSFKQYPQIKFDDIKKDFQGGINKVWQNIDGR